jgi:hypothetical protein
MNSSEQAIPLEPPKAVLHSTGRSTSLSNRSSPRATEPKTRRFRAPRPTQKHISRLCWRVARKRPAVRVFERTATLPWLPIEIQDPLRRFLNQPVAEIVQCGEPASAHASRELRLGRPSADPQTREQIAGGGCLDEASERRRRTTPRTHNLILQSSGCFSKLRTSPTRTRIHAEFLAATFLLHLVHEHTGKAFRLHPAQRR